MCLTTKKLKFIAPPVRTYTALKNNAENTIQDPTNNQTISLECFTPFFKKITIKNQEKQDVEISTRISFSPHCYTRGFNEDKDDPAHILLTEQPRNSTTINKRVFDGQRYIFANHLKQELENNLATLKCLEGRDDQVVLNFEARDLTNRNVGWYTFIRVQINAKFPKILQIEIQSIHKRTNKPENLVGTYPKLMHQHISRILF
jgi:hypothetical protein